MTVETMTLKDTMTYEQEPMLTYSIEYPVFHSPQFQLSLRRINRFYQERALSFQTYLTTERYQQAIEQYKQLLEHNFPMHPFESVVRFQVTYQNNCIISLYTDTYEFTGGAHGNTIRDSQTWNLSKNTQLEIEDLYSCGGNLESFLLLQIQAQIEKEPEIYFKDSKKLAAEMLRLENFYCSTSDLTVFYQQYDIAPYSSGIRTFSMPYSDCIKNPATTCLNKK